MPGAYRRWRDPGKSPSVMMGYYKEPDKTAEAITEDGWLCTGDLGYVDEENFLYLTGRKKNLIILSNGENVAPEQLENLFVDDRLIEDILVYGEDDMIAAEIYPNFKYADAAGIDHIEETVAQIIKSTMKDFLSIRRLPVSICVTFHLRKLLPKRLSAASISARRSRRQRSRSMYINRKMISSRRSMMQYLPC